MNGPPYQIYQGARYDPWKPPPPARGSQSLVFKRMNIEPGQPVKMTSKDASWVLGNTFSPSGLVYVGSPDFWILERSYAGGIALFGAEIPCDSFRPGCPSGIDWPILQCFVGASGEIDMNVENRGDKVGHFIIRLAGNFEQY